MTATSQPPAPPTNTTSPPIRRPIKRAKFPVVDLYSTAVGKKWAMAVSGLVLMGYVFAHMVGNLKMYLGAEDMNHYAEWLRAGLLVPIVPEEVALWLMRVALITAFLVHLHAAYSLTILNRKARPVAYQSPRDYIAVSWAARTMRWTGIIVLLFVLFHLADLTFGWANPDFVHGDVYQNVADSFERLPVAILYVVANVALGFHLYHGTWSIFQSMGSMNPRFNPRHNPLRRGFALVFAAIITLGNVSFPIAVQAGIVG